MTSEQQPAAEKCLCGGNLIPLPNGRRCDSCAYSATRHHIPDAGKMAESVKPCPFCGDERKIVPMQQDGEICAGASCNCIGQRRIQLDKWNNAWAHRRIAELEWQLSKKKISKEMFDHIADLERQLKEANELIAMNSKWLDKRTRKINDLEQQVRELSQKLDTPK